MSSIHERPRAAITRWFRSDRLSAIVATGIAAFAVGLLSLAVPAPAQAAPMHTWSATTVCVESHVGSEWGVRSAIRTWNELDGGPTSRPGGQLHRLRRLRDRELPLDNANNRYTGWTKW